jgi:XTP/dITP diphosphohydrolase
MKLSRGDELVIASHNPGKVREIAELVARLGIRTRSASEVGLPEPAETGSTFAENAALKAVNAARASDRIALADDSGLSVNALDGAPGIFSARWAGPDKDFSMAMARVERELRARSCPDSTARFTCALALASPAGEVQVFEGEVRGKLVFPPRGNKGFGYDPIFVADGMDKTFGEIEPAAKHGMSHRARAFEQLLHSDVFRS